jgi:hypothetical protein
VPANSQEILLWAVALSGGLSDVFSSLPSSSSSSERENSEVWCEDNSSELVVEGLGMLFPKKWVVCRSTSASREVLGWLEVRAGGFSPDLSEGI